MAKPATVDSATTGAKKRALDDARETALLRKPPQPPCPGPSRPIACRNPFAELAPLIEELLSAKEATVVLRAERFRHGTMWELNVSLVPSKDDAETISRFWVSSPPLTNDVGKPGDPPRVRFWKTPGMTPERSIPSESLAKLDELRDGAMKQVLLFTKAVGAVEPLWLELHAEFFAKLEAWVRGWKADPWTPAWPITPGEQPLDRPSDTATLQVDQDLMDNLRRLLAQGGECLMPPLKVHFLLNQPERDDQQEGVLAYPDLDEAGAIARELKTILERALKPPRIVIAGHTDRLGGREHNRPLSERRARWLLRNLKGVDLSSAVVVGCGDERAPEREESPEHRFAEVVVEPS